ncbi:hypothetical protein LY90DRAFT_230316 [Neocallimastix californiae]|uniref:G-protein coupled receptors family 3 profile domain-containing protein n=1 Tax=Neocallimastix californiae TaxID=1754190 RepID=A0A1Y1YNQ1_9FUNG|nr:hypothetical protein LY90DRAFT_230316 [Neocallimastix californiae]|eukprot:ORX99670.1 hypothetical protein LY90DRAFT_230316 [Neocallimastix californiae]
MFQIILLTLWTFTQKGIESTDMYIRNVGYIKYAKCSTKNIELIDFMFFIDYVLLLLSIRISYLGRNIPDEFNDSKKIHITSLISIFQLISCNLAVNFSIDNTIIFALIIFFMGLISFININIFITPKILVALDLINNMSQQTSVLIVNNSNTNFNQ